MRGHAINLMVIDIVISGLGEDELLFQFFKKISMGNSFQKLSGMSYLEKLKERKGD